MFNYMIDMFLDQMTLAGFTAARWWASVAMGAPIAKGE